MLRRKREGWGGTHEGWGAAVVVAAAVVIAQPKRSALPKPCCFRLVANAGPMHAARQPRPWIAGMQG